VVLPPTAVDMDPYMKSSNQKVEEAVAAEQRNDLEAAKAYYVQAILELQKAKKQANRPPQAMAALSNRMQEYLERAEWCKRVLEERASAAAGGNGGAAAPAAAAKPPALIGAQQKDQALMDSLKGAIVVEKPMVRWDEVAGLYEAKVVLRDATEFPQLFPHLFKCGALKPWKGVLLYGPPGTGKTFLAKAVAANAGDGTTFLSISSADLVSKWVGESARLVKSLFWLAREKAPSVVFVDEVDSLCGSRDGGGGQKSESSHQLLTEFLRQMDGCGPAIEGTLIVAATNVPWDLDQAILSRFQKKLYIPLPPQKIRGEMIGIHLRQDRVELSASDLAQLGFSTDGFSARDIGALVQAALAEAMGEFRVAQQWRRVTPHPYDASLGYALEPVVGAPGGSDLRMTITQMQQDEEARKRTILPLIRMGHFEVAVRKVKASVTKEDLVRFQEWTEKFGVDGSGDTY